MRNHVFCGVRNDGATVVLGLLPFGDGLCRADPRPRGGDRLSTGADRRPRRSSELAAVAQRALGGFASLSAGSPNHSGRQWTRQNLRRKNLRQHTGMDQFMGDASPSEILGSADCLPARSVCGKNGRVDANAGLYSIWRWTPHLHRPLFALLEAEMVMAQLLSCYAISLPGARPVLPVGRLTIEPSYEPLFRLDSV